MSFIGIMIRRLLDRSGYLLTRVEPEFPPSLGAILQALKARYKPALSILCFDNEVRVQAELLQIFPAVQISFWSPCFRVTNGGVESTAGLPPVPAGRFMVLIDLDHFPLDLLQEKLPWLKHAEAVLLRARLGSFWAGELDFCQLSARLRQLGFQVAEVIHPVCAASLQAPSDSATAVFEPGDGTGSALSKGSRYRVNEAMTHLSRPIVKRQDFHLLAGRGSLGFAAGVCNPGAIMEGDQKYLLSRGERTPWPLQKADESRFFSSTQPLLLKLSNDNCITGADELTKDGAPNPTRIEDFRLFKFRGEILSNHAVIANPEPGPVKHRPLRLERMKTRVGISLLDVKAKRLVWCGFPSVDRPLAQTEKNWVFFTAGDRLFLLYSFSPYILMSAQNWPGLNFKTFIETRLPLTLDGDGLALRNSINPVEYDDDHWLHIIHKVYPGKQYSFWAVLISKKDLLPTRISARPLVSGWHSVSASIIYTCSALVDGSHITICAGLDDSATAMATISRNRLDGEWIPIGSQPASAS